MRWIRRNDLTPWRRVAIAAAVACAVSVAACGGDMEEEGIAEGDVAPMTTATWGDADMDGDARLAENEFGAYWRNAGLYDRWNAGGDGLDRDEVSRGIFGVWDRNEAGITEDEWNTGSRAWFAGNTNYGAFDEWDANDDQLIEENEFIAGSSRYDVWSGWDENRNQMYEENELFGGLFDIFDGNRDTYLDENEWRMGYDNWDWGM